jgi:HEPN domain-containing protein
MQPSSGSPADWLRFAQSDLDDAAEIPTGRILFETKCFHAQQAVEKSLKALLVAKRIEYPLTHNLRIILNLLPPDLPPPADPVDIGELTEYAVSSRYPGMDEPVTEEQYQEAVSLARTVVSWAEEILRKMNAL